MTRKKKNQSDLPTDGSTPIYIQLVTLYPHGKDPYKRYSIHMMKGFARIGQYVTTLEKARECAEMIGKDYNDGKPYTIIELEERK